MTFWPEEVRGSPVDRPAGRPVGEVPNLVGL